MAELVGVQWLNLKSLSKALRLVLAQGDFIEVELVKPGKEDG